MDRRVEVYGTTRHDLNGKRGVATDFLHPGGGNTEPDPGDRYTVRLDSGETYKIRPAQLHAETLRFKVGSEVECTVDASGNWVPGVVLACWYREAKWPRHQPDAAYQVRLIGGGHQGRLVYAPCDTAWFIRERATSVRKGKGKGKGKKGRGGGGK